MLPQSGEGAFPLVERHLAPSCRSAGPPPQANCCGHPNRATWRGPGPEGLSVRQGISQASASCAVAQPLGWHLVGGLATVPTAAPVSIPACGSAAFPWSLLGVEASRTRTEMQRGSGVPGAGWETGILHPLQA